MISAVEHSVFIKGGWWNLPTKEMMRRPFVSSSSEINQTIDKEVDVLTGEIKATVEHVR